MILAASAMPAGAQGVAATANWVTPINANNGISTPETVAASDNNTFLVSKFVSKGNDNSLNFVNFGSQEKVAFGAPNKATSGNDNLLLTKVNADGTAAWHVYSKQGRVANASAATTSDGGVVVAAVTSFTAFNAKDATDIPANSILDIVDADNHTTTIEKAFAGSAVYDIVVLKISADGHLDWFKHFAADDASSLTAKIAVDNADNIYIGGQHAKTLSFGENAVAARSAKSLYLVKLDNAGNFVKSFDISGTDAEDYIDAVTFADGKIFVAGRVKAKAEGNTIAFADITLAPTTFDDVFAAAFSTDLVPVWASIANSVAASDGKHTSQVKGIDVSEGFVLVSGLVKGGYTAAGATDAVTMSSGTKLEGMVIGFSIADGALSKGVCVSEGISGLYSATIKGNKIYAFGYNIANADKQGSSLFEFDGENANENVIATTNEPASAGYPTTFYAKFVNSSLLAGVRAKGKGINVLGNVYDYTNQKDFTATVMSINLKDILGGISTTETADDARIWAVSGAVKVSVASPTSVAVYNVAGQIVAKRIVTDETTIALPAGFYIVNGKKVVVK
ncbi:MAG: T9SS C-terminal target domain-containing protein [Bacteroidales bacterium]|nr:T9SS C-terminal target domain-containing protein [Bacteroidales bacterium]